MKAMKVKKTHRNFLLLFSATVFALFLAGGVIRVVLGQTPIEVSTFCQYQNGQIYAIKTSEGGLAECKRNGQVITIGPGSAMETTGFINATGWYLDPSGKLWRNDGSWKEVPQTLPVAVSNIVQWGGDNVLLDTSGNLWKFTVNYGDAGEITTKWENLGHP